jgi:low temperature requirement protein LtrA
MASAGLLSDPEAEKGDRVGFIELFFDLVFVFAVTQLAHRLVEHPSPRGVAESLVLFLAVWSVWTGTTWVTNRLDVERNAVRLLLLAMTVGGLFQALAIPDAFKYRLDARGFALVQLGRTLFVLVAFYDRHELHHRQPAHVPVGACGGAILEPRGARIRRRAALQVGRGNGG